MSQGLRKCVAGRSREGRSIQAHIREGASRRTVMVLGGFHGDEPKSVFVAARLVDLLSETKPTGLATWIVVPVVNPDGYMRRKRRNARGVDINRNFPTRNWVPSSPRSRMYGGPSPASEPETRVVIRLLEKYRPDRIVTIHSIGRERFCNNYDGPAHSLATRMRRHNGYPITASIGYPTPGSFGNWAGKERRIPVITLELRSTDSPQRCWADNREAILSLGR